MRTAQAPCLTTFLLSSIIKKVRRRGDRGCVLAGAEHCYALCYMPHEEELFASKLPSHTAVCYRFARVQKIKKEQPRARGSRVTGDGALLRRGMPERSKNQSCGVTRSCPPLRATRNIPYSIKNNNVTENRPMLHNQKQRSEN